MPDPVPSDAHTSSNLAKYTTPNPLYRWHIEAFQAAIYELVEAAAPASVLDAGCGEGFLAAYLHAQDASLRIEGLDADPGAVAFAQEHHAGAARFQTGDVFALPFPDDAFDLVICSEVLEHLQEPAAALTELKRVARRHVLVTVPLEPYFKFFNDLARALGISPDPGHVQFWRHPAFQRFIGAHLQQPVFRTKHYYQLALGRV